MQKPALEDPLTSSQSYSLEILLHKDPIHFQATEHVAIPCRDRLVNATDLPNWELLSPGGASIQTCVATKRNPSSALASTAERTIGLKNDDKMMSMGVFAAKHEILKDEMGVIPYRLLSMLRRSPPNETDTHSPNGESAAVTEKVAVTSDQIPATQQVLILHDVKQEYKEQLEYPVPSLREEDEVLVRNSVIGLNPIDWKAPDYNFGIPTLPYISGRELAGTITTTSLKSSRISLGDRALVISTDYRDLRKAAYQQYVVANYFNIARLPPNIPSEAGASLGVAFVAAALSLGVCAGLDFSVVSDGPDLLSILRSIDPSRLPEDIRAECLTGLETKDRLSQGDWLAIWGGSSTSAYMISQLAQLCGVKTMSILDLQKHGHRQHATDETPRADVLVDSHDSQRAIAITRAVARNKLRFGIDTVGRSTASSLLACLEASPESVQTRKETTPNNTIGTPPATPPLSLSNSPTVSPLSRSHLIGLTGLPKRDSAAPVSDDCVFHTVPIKVFHEIPETGEALMVWLEKLLAEGKLKPPAILAVEHGFDAVNGALDRMRRGEISGGRVVVRVD